METDRHVYSLKQVEPGLSMNILSANKSQNKPDQSWTITRDSLGCWVKFHHLVFIFI